MRAFALGLLVWLVGFAAPPADGISGRWAGGVDLAAEGETNRLVITCEFAVADRTVTGHLETSPDTRFKFDGGVFDGNTVTFAVAAPTRVFRFTLRVADKNRLVGIVESQDRKAKGEVILAREHAPAYTREDFPEIKRDYLGQHAPGTTPERFAPGIVSVAGMVDSVPQFTPDGREVYWSRVGPGGGVMVSREVDGRWTPPERAPFAVPGEMDMAPILFDGGRKLLVHSTRALPDGRKPQRGFFTFWIASREGSTFRVPMTPLDSFYTGTDDFSTIADDGTLYLGPARGSGAITRVARQGAGYGKREVVTPAVGGFPALVGSRGDWLVVAKGAENRDLFILFRQPDGTFTAPINMGPAVNSPASEQFAALSPDGRFFFFCSDRSGDFDAYWLNAGFIADLRKQVATDRRPYGSEAVAAGPGVARSSHLIRTP